MFYFSEGCVDIATGKSHLKGLPWQQPIGLLVQSPLVPQAVLLETQPEVCLPRSGSEHLSLEWITFLTSGLVFQDSHFKYYVPIDSLRLQITMLLFLVSNPSTERGPIELSAPYRIKTQRGLGQQARLGPNCFSQLEYSLNCLPHLQG